MEKFFWLLAAIVILGGDTMTIDTKMSASRKKRNSLFEMHNLNDIACAEQKAGRYFRWSWPF